jgi:hypothetical protein
MALYGIETESQSESRTRLWCEDDRDVVGLLVPNLDVVQTNFSVVLLFFW